MAVRPIPEGHNSVSPYLVVPGVSKLMDFLKATFDAKEVTHAEYAEFVRATMRLAPYHWVKGEMPAELAKVAVYNVNWDDAKAYCDFRGKRLPTEAEWERAARGGVEGADYPWGPKFDAKLARHNTETGPGEPAKYPPNPFGLFDMAGNLAEWTTPPFELTVDGEVMRGRGATDDKGPVYIVLKVAQSFIEQEGKLPLNVKFLFEGEEEIGSPNLPAFLRAHAEEFTADLVISADGAMWRPTGGMRRSSSPTTGGRTQRGGISPSTRCQCRRRVRSLTISTVFPILRPVSCGSSAIRRLGLPRTFSVSSGSSVSRRGMQPRMLRPIRGRCGLSVRALPASACCRRSGCGARSSEFSRRPIQGTRWR